MQLLNDPRMCPTMSNRQVLRACFWSLVGTGATTLAGGALRFFAEISHQVTISIVAVVIGSLMTATYVVGTTIISCNIKTSWRIPLWWQWAGISGTLLGVNVGYVAVVAWL